MANICLNMIVKNESAVITRCLNSVYKYIDYYVISDTGSIDSTKKRIRNFMNKCQINGKISNHKWINFADNRNLALDKIPKHVKYALFIDADDELMTVCEDKQWLYSLDQDIYYITKDINGVTHLVPFLIKINDPNIVWRWRSPVHNQLDCVKGIPSKAIISSDIIYIRSHQNEGAKTHKFLNDIREKYLHDATILESIPNRDVMQQFHLAQSYYNAEKWSLATQNYYKTINITNDPELIYYCKFKIGGCAIKLGYTTSRVKELLLNAHNQRPTRTEAIFELIKYYHDLKMYTDGYNLAKECIPLMKCIPTDTFLIDNNIHRHHFWDKYAVCACNSGHVKDAINALQTVLSLGWCNERCTRIYRDYLHQLQK